MKKPVIGIFGNTISTSSEKFGAIPKSALNLAYSDAVIRNGGIPVIFPSTGDEQTLLDLAKLCDGVIVPGGVDVDPAYFNEEPERQIGKLDLQLDKAEMLVLNYLLENNVPTLGICRGCQIMNIFAGGSVYQDLPAQYPGHPLMHAQKGKRSYPLHEVSIEEGSRLAGLLGTTSVRTNTMHHQAIKDAGKGFTVVGRAKDGVVEAIEHENGCWIAVQWHPEELVDTVPAMNNLFRDLIEKAAK